MNPSIQLLQGDARDLLRTLPAESVNTVCTSPPYWGLRDYNLPPSIWGGDPACQHTWGEAVRTPWANRVPGPNGRKKNTEAGHRRPKETGPFCAHCGAWKGSLGMEPTPEQFVENIVAVFREVHRVLRPDGTLWLNLGDSYSGSWGNYGVRTGKQRRRNEESWERKGYAEFRDPPATAGRIGLAGKNLVGVPWRCALALQADGWILRSDVIWHKPNCTPESVKDRPTKAHEYIFLFSKSARYHYDGDSIREPTGNEMSWEEYAARTAPGATWELGGITRYAGAHKKDGGKSHPLGRNKRTVWSIPTKSVGGGVHFATFPPDLVRPMILAGCPASGVVLDPFAGAGTTLLVAQQLGRASIGLELNPDYAALAAERTAPSSLQGPCS